MTIFSSPEKAPYYAVSLSSCLIIEDITYRILLEKMLQLATEQDGFLGLESGGGEVGFVNTYWRTKEAAQAWINHPTLRRVLSIGENVWYQSYSVKLVEVLESSEFKNTSIDPHGGRYPKLITPRGVLTILNESQAHLLHEYVNEEKAFLAPWEPFRDEGYYSLGTCLLRVKEMRRDFLEDKAVTFCFLSPDESKMLGYTNYSGFVRGVFHACNLGYSLREKEQGKGLMKEALEEGIKYLQQKCHMHRIQASYMPRNEKSASVLNNLGFEKEGRARDYLKINGVWEDHILTSLILD
ncbi:GNAT family N-acetyltransferase [Marinomonas sp. C2222]|uniref:GNAT family N-acetyltransferase n=1 Tax=Marinomonas sargassi TaxID=2984494 RepID=A0ABT2YR28_9GAMM|nr:GNAT family N-acetyltransferase [Marinomonas sargassi]MCV2402336.1 GNAT family N-acetyltransferase [Marinomonas sargassi]